MFTRVAALFARRAFNIHSLTVGETKDLCISCMTVAVDAVKLPTEQVTKQSDKLVDVLKIVEPDPAAAVKRQLLLVKISANDSSWANVLQTTDLFRVHVVDVVPGTVTAEATESDVRVEASLTTLEPYGVREIVQSDAVAITRGAHSLLE